MLGTGAVLHLLLRIARSDAFHGFPLLRHPLAVGSPAK
jgi:hypothetical protein